MVIGHDYTLRSFPTHSSWTGKPHYLYLTKVKSLPRGFPGGASGKESTCQCRRQGRRIRSLGRVDPLGSSGNGNPLQFSCLENPMDRGAWWTTVHGTAKSLTQLSDWAHMCVHTHTHTHTRTSLAKIIQIITKWRSPKLARQIGSRGLWCSSLTILPLPAWNYSLALYCELGTRGKGLLGLELGARAGRVGLLPRAAQWW